MTIINQGIFLQIEENKFLLGGKKWNQFFNKPDQFMFYCCGGNRL